MLITRKFNFIHMPKTGGTFVTAVLERLHQPPRRGLLGRALAKARRLLGGSTAQWSRYGALENIEPKHGTCHDIPPPHRAKPILSCMRGPQEWYVSQYEFAWWKRTHLYDPKGPPTPAGYAIEQVLPAFAASRPHFPNVSFAEFMELCEQASRVYDPEGRLGLYTHGFTRYFFKKPVEALAAFTAPYFSSGKAQQDMFDIHFIRTEALNQELAAYLRQQGYRDSDTRFISGLQKILPDGRGRRDDQRWQDYYTPALERYVRDKDWPLYQIFPQYR